MNFVMSFYELNNKCCKIKGPGQRNRRAHAQTLAYAIIIHVYRPTR